MRYWYDTEFIENGSSIDLISLGIVAEDGREYYAQSINFSWGMANGWVKRRVYPQLRRCSYRNGLVRGTQGQGGGIESIHRSKIYHQVDTHGRCDLACCPWRSGEQLKADILAFMDIEKYGKPEMWGYYSAYDHVAFCQLFGSMMDLPEGFPMYTRDLKQWADMLGNPQLPAQDKGEHDALADARWNQRVWSFLGYVSRSIENVILSVH